MERRAIVLAVLVAALLTALSGCSRGPEVSFAYVDDQTRVVLYNMKAERQVWISKLKGPPNGSPAWRADGKTLAYVCKDPDLGKWYLALFSVDSKKETLVELKDSPAAWGCFDIGATIDWSPSSRFLSVEDWGYPPCPITIVDVAEKKVLAYFLGDGDPLWLPDDSKVAYVQMQGKLFYDLFTCELDVLDASSGKSTVLVKGDRGYTIIPEQWTDKGAVIYRYVGHGGADKQKLDTQGGTYEYPKESPQSPTSTIVTPPGFPTDLGHLQATNRDPKTGEWLVAVTPEKGTSWIYRYIEGNGPTRLVQGRYPVWQGAPPTVPR